MRSGLKNGLCSTLLSVINFTILGELVGSEEMVMDSVKAQGFIDADEMSMGIDISTIDLYNVNMSAA